MLDFVVHRFRELVTRGETYLFLLPIYAGLLATERIAHGVLSERKWNDRDGAANIAITVAYLAFDLLVGKLLPLAAMAFLYEHARIVTLSDTWHGWLAAFLLHDLIWYVDHRMAHRTALFWSFHHVHHSSEEMNTTVASRGFLLDNSLTRPLYYLVPILGVSPFMFIALRILASIWGIAQHTRLVPKLPGLDWLLATPSSHRVHHGSNAKYIDKNYGEVLMIWDHLFGTYQREEEEPAFGVTERLETYNPIKIELAGLSWLWRRVAPATSARDALRRLIKPPEWQPSEPARSSAHPLRYRSSAQRTR